MLIGAYFGWQTALFITYKSTLRRARANEAIGIGASFAMNAMNYFALVPEVKFLEVFAAGVIADTKEFIEGCGKHTAVVTIHKCRIVDEGNGKPTHLEHPERFITQVSPYRIQKWEQSFAAKWSPMQQELLAKLIQEEVQDDEVRLLEPQS